MTLSEFFHANKRAALGFSGGTDSAYLLYAGLQCGAEIRPYYIKTAFQPQFELDDAMRLAKQLKAELTILTWDILSPAVAANTADRCYYCKRALFSALQRRAIKDGYPLLIDGTNASDDAGDRPGMRALHELSVRSPLRECGLTKDEIRRLSKEAGLFTWDKPAYACLSTRIPTGRPITAELLQQVEASENVLFSLGFSDFRLRVYGDAARLQLPQAQMGKVMEFREEICRAIKPYFNIILLDLAGR